MRYFASRGVKVKTVRVGVEFVDVLLENIMEYKHL